MACTGWWFIWSYCLAFILLKYGEGVRVTVRETNLEVVQGDSVTLPCSFFTMMPLFRLNIIWTFMSPSDPQSPTQVIVYDNGQVIESPAFTGRVGFAGIPWSADIILNSTRVSDAGIYRCVVSNPPETGDPGIGELSLSVLAPPSLPVCLWDGDAGAGGTVSLSCMVSEGMPTPEMRWEKLEPEQVSLPVIMEEDHTGSVHIANVSSQTSGLYRCSVTNVLGTQNCYVNLSVYTSSHSSPGILQGVLLTLSMALVLLALLVLVLWLHRSGQEIKWRDGGEEDECYNEIRYTPSLMKRSFV
ncbi:immunoglobulin superfamily member 11 [Chanos chanos]|uniref:immunoglobulin superfamily member 11 n=1 Tax=Chanos chanos TaxID=29144 RepID=UPI0011F304D8|nr:immunoglobulin superfamily member 11-like [Chanos chanos]